MSFLMSFVIENGLLSWTLLLFRESGFAFTRLDGSMAQKKRAEAVQCFQSSRAGSPTVMLLSLKAGGVGLNLTAASRVFLMDPVSTGLLVLAWRALGAAPVVFCCGWKESPSEHEQRWRVSVSGQAGLLLIRFPACFCFNTVFRAVCLFTVSEKNVGSTVKKLLWHLTVQYLVSVPLFLSPFVW